MSLKANHRQETHCKLWLSNMHEYVLRSRLSKFFQQVHSISNDNTNTTNTTNSTQTTHFSQAEHGKNTLEVRAPGIPRRAAEIVFQMIRSEYIDPTWTRENIALAIVVLWSFYLHQEAVPLCQRLANMEHKNDTSPSKSTHGNKKRRTRL